MNVELFNVSNLRHIEGHSAKRVLWLKDKIIKEGIWNKPLALDYEFGLVLDGQHRMEVALLLNLKKVPVIRFHYSDVSLRSLRKKYNFDWKDVVKNTLSGNIYPYKTVKHDFDFPLPKISYKIDELK